MVPVCMALQIVFRNIYSLLDVSSGRIVRYSVIGFGGSSGTTNDSSPSGLVCMITSLVISSYVSIVLYALADVVGTISC